MQTAVTPDCLVSALISLPVPAAPNFQHLESGETFPCSPGTHHTSKQLVNTGRAGRQESIKNNHRTHALVFLPLVFTQGCFCLHVHCCSCPCTGHWAAWALATYRLSPLSYDVLFRKRFHTSGSAVIFFGGASKFQLYPDLQGLAVLAAWQDVLTGGQDSWWDSRVKQAVLHTQMSCFGPLCRINNSPSCSHKSDVKLL